MHGDQFNEDFNKHKAQMDTLVENMSGGGGDREHEWRGEAEMIWLQFAAAVTAFHDVSDPNDESRVILLERTSACVGEMEKLSKVSMRVLDDRPEPNNPRP